MELTGKNKMNNEVWGVLTGLTHKSLTFGTDF